MCTELQQCRIASRKHDQGMRCYASSTTSITIIALDWTRFSNKPSIDKHSSVIWPEIYMLPRVILPLIIDPLEDRDQGII